MASEVAEALKQIRACEEEARRIVSEAREHAAKIVRDAEE
ncbi:V-type ATP synthase subunit H, partial [Archaeoglobales archaeon]